MLQVAEKRSDIIERLDLAPKEYAVATLHRAENTDDAKKMRQIFAYLSERARGVGVVLPLHPRTRAAAQRHGIRIDAEGLRVIEPIGYLDMCRLLHHACEVLTDSGGLQKEAYFHRVPCVTLRDETEWVETIEHGWNRLWRGEPYRQRSDISDYGTGNAAAKIVGALKNVFA
jgi:UDP-GlcNAc3NAcA epimerase